jgi:hypothetical protein
MKIMKLNKTEAENHLNEIIESWIKSDAVTRILTAEDIAIRVGIIFDDFQGKNAIDFITEAFWAGYSKATELQLKISKEERRRFEIQKFN